MDGTSSSQQTHPGQPGSEGGFPLVDRQIERNTGTLESQLHLASTPPMPQVAGSDISKGDSGQPHQVGFSAPLGAEPLVSQDKPGDRGPSALQQEMWPSFDSKVEFKERSSKEDENQNAIKDETSGGVSVRGPVDNESVELDANQTGSDDGASDKRNNNDSRESAEVFHFNPFEKRRNMFLGKYFKCL